MADLEITLSWLGMSKYLDRFLEAGFDSWETVLEITEDDLEVLNVDLGHRRKLQREIANTKKLAKDPAFVKPLYGIGPQSPGPGESWASTSDTPQAIGPTKRGYRHHPKPDTNAPERPYSAYVLFSNHTRDHLKNQNLSFTELSRQVGARWRSLTPEDKEHWKQKAAVPWEKYKADLAAYQNSEEYREYQKYLNDFKAAQAVRAPEKRVRQTQQQRPSSSKRAGRFSTVHTSGPSTTNSTRSKMAPAAARPRSSKVAIKRLKQEDERWTSTEGIRTARVRQACEPCRSRKIKCHGEQPQCRHCRDIDTDCYYENGKWDLKKEQEENVWQKLRAYEDLLKQAMPQLKEDAQQTIQDALLLPPQLESCRHAYGPTYNAQAGNDSSNHSDGESEETGVGSMGSTDHVNQTNFAGADGRAFMGQASETKWVGRLQKEFGGDDEKDGNEQDLGSQDHHPYSEDMDTSIVGHQIDPFSLPLKSTADALVNSFFSTVHLSFPIINKAGFMLQYQRLSNTIDPATYPDRTFIAVLQMVFAIGAVHAHLVEAEWAGDGRDHMLYFAQARTQAVDTGILNDRCYLGQVQVFGLGSMYLLATDQINRAWNLTGLAIRAAQSLGLHLRDTSSSISVAERMARAQIWYSLTSLEVMLVVITGRPSMVNSRDCSVSLAQAFSEEGATSHTTSPSEKSHPLSAMDEPLTSPNISQPRAQALGNLAAPVASTYFMHYTELCALAKRVIGELYYPGIRKRKWSQIQSIMEDLDRRLLAWQESLRPPFNVDTPSSDPNIESCRFALRILFHSIRTTINRPCLCRLDQRIAEQYPASKQKSRAFANNCVGSACQTLDLILHRPEYTTLRQGTIWWMLLHHLKRGLTVILLELAFGAEHVSADASNLLFRAKEAVAWLRWLGNSSPSARGTSIRMSRLLYNAAQKIGGDTSDIFPPDFQQQPQQPPAGFRHPQQHLQAVQQSHPAAYNMDNPIPNESPNTFPGGYGTGEGLYFSDLAGRSELDQFGFLREEGGLGSFFPTASEMVGMEEHRELGEDALMGYAGEPYYDFGGGARLEEGGEGGGEEGENMHR